MPKTIEMKLNFKLLDQADLEIKSIDEQTRTIWHPITREVPDRYGDVVRIDGADFSEFQRKPAVLYGHDYRSMNPLPVIGENVGFEKDGDRLFAGTKFIPVDTPGMSQGLKDLINDNWLLQAKKLLGWSIGFMELETAQILEGGKFKGYDFKRWKLLEYSSVIIPAHQDAVNNAIAAGEVTESIKKYFIFTMPEDGRALAKAAEIQTEPQTSDNLARSTTPAPEPEPASPIQADPGGADISTESDGKAAGESAENPEPEKPIEIKSKSKGENMLKDILTKLAAGKDLEQGEIDYLTTLEATKTAQDEQPNRRLQLTDESGVRIRSMAQIVNMPSRLLNSDERALQEFNDDMVIMGTLLKKDPRKLKSWDQQLNHSSALRKALDAATANEGAEFVPTLLSADFIERMRLGAKVAALFPDLPMPSNPWTLPYFGGVNADDFYFVGESTSDAPAGSPLSTPDTASQTLTAKKLKARLRFSDELNEDSIVAILPTLRADIVTAGREALEDVLINGDTTATHQDSDVVSSQDRRKAFKGLRIYAQSGNKADLSTFSTANYLALKVTMAKYGINPADLAVIAGAKSYNKFLGLTEVLTVDKYGANAVILTGELGKIMGAPILVSEAIRENLNNSGVYDGSTTTQTEFLIVNRRGFMLGSRGGIKLTFKNDDDTDQNQLTMSFRKAFQPRWTPSATVGTVAVGYKVS